MPNTMRGIFSYQTILKQAVTNLSVTMDAEEYATFCLALENNLKQFKDLVVEEDVCRNPQFYLSKNNG